ncbi:hypothetical protein [Microcoleus sp. OTE_8_concoct_300]
MVVTVINPQSTGAITYSRAFRTKGDRAFGCKGDRTFDQPHMNRDG